MTGGSNFRKFEVALIGLFVFLTLSGAGCRKEKPNSMFAPPTTPPPADSGAPTPPPQKILNNP